MEQKCHSCLSCGMPLKQAEDHALGKTDIPYCSHCTNEKGMLKSYEEVRTGMSHYLIHSQGIDPAAAQQMAEAMMMKLPAWKGK